MSCSSNQPELVGPCPRCNRPAHHRSGFILDCPTCGLVERQHHSGTAMYCRGCSYNLTGQTATYCPECGLLVSLDQLHNMGVLPTEQFADRIELLQQRFLNSKAGAGMAPLHAPDPGLQESQTDDAMARRLLPRLPTIGQLYDILRRTGSSAPDALLRVYEASRHLNGGAMTNTAAVAVLPRSIACRELYHHLRKLGYEWHQALALILPRSKSYRTDWG